MVARMGDEVANGAGSLSVAGLALPSARGIDGLALLLLPCALDMAGAPKFRVSGSGTLSC